MKVSDIARIIESEASLGWKLDFDSTGLAVGSMDDPVSAVLISVDITESVVEEAVSLGADMIVTHHPLLFHPLRRLSDSTYVERAVRMAVRSGIALYSAHTNLDSAPCGISHRLGGMLGLTETGILDPNPAADGIGIGIVGEYPQPVDVMEFLSRVRSVLGCRMLRHSDPAGPEVSRVAICSGAGGSLIGQARAAGAQAYIAADFKYNDFLDADRDLMIVDAGHYETEYCAIDILHEIIRKKLPTFALYRSGKSRNPVNYFI